MTENLTLSSSGLALSPSLVFLPTELRACVWSPNGLTVPSAFHTTTLS